MKRSINISLQGFFIQAIFALGILLSPQKAFPEGTKQLRPDSTDYGYVEIWDFMNDFALVGSTVEERLHIRVCNVGEIIHMGFNLFDNDDIDFRLVNPLGIVVMGLQDIPNVGQEGYINTWKEAVTGPEEAVGASGYDALSYTTLLTGDYYIEFFRNVVTDRDQLRYFDISVEDLSGNINDGRLWSQSWNLTTRGFANPFNSTMYIYTDDSIVNSVTFTDMLPFGMVIEANENGLQNTGDIAADRKSAIGSISFPQYKLFLNDPDEDCFPSGQVDQVAVNLEGCDNDICINVTSSTSGWVEVFLELNGIAGFQSGTADRSLSDSVGVGITCIPWDGLDGLGSQVARGTDIEVMTRLAGEAVHLPLMDAESNPNGLLVSFVRPYTGTPLLYWDDADVSGTTELNGCSNPAGCHDWVGGDGVGIGDLNTINTWWFTPAAVDTAQHTIPDPTVDLGPPQTICGGANVVLNAGTKPSVTYSWSTGVSGATDSTITVNQTGTYSVTIDAGGNCTDNDNVAITVDTVIASAGADTTICVGDAAQLNASASGGTGPFTYVWTPAGSLSNPNINNPSATPGTSTTYTVTATNANTCEGTDVVIVSVPTALTLTPGKIDVACNGGNDGVASVAPGGGTPNYNYSWSTGSTDSLSTGVTQGTYTVTVTDNIGCTNDASVTVNEPTALSLATSKTDVTCNAGSNGSATVTPSGATTPYTYLWGNGDTDSTSAGLTQGNYPVTVTDGNGCTENTSVTVNEPTALTLATSKTDVACNAGSNGSATVTPSGATTPYTYLWGNGDTDSTSAGLTQGNYPVTVTDGNGCTENASVTVNEPTALTLATSKTDVTCNAGSNGSATVTPSGATTPYSYSWGNGDTDSTSAGLTQGTYPVTVTDGNGCTENASVTVNEPTALTLATSKTDVTCNAGSNGSATVTPSGATTPYNYLWGNGDTDSTSAGLTQGNYPVTVTDGNGCTENASVTVNEPTALTLATSKTDVACNAGSNGSATVTPSGATTPYTYLWGNGDTDSTSAGLTQGNYPVTVTDGNGCTENTSVTVNEPTALSLATSKTDVACNAGSNGSATVTPSGATTPYSYLWGNGDTDSTSAGLTQGTYPVTVTDGNGCTENASVTVNEPTALTLATSKTDVTCNAGSNGSATVTPSGATTPYTYLWGNGDTDSTSAGLTQGNYPVTVTDGNGCTENASVTVNEPTALSLATSKTDVACNAGSNGSATITPSGATTPYTYLWGNGDTDSTSAGLTQGTYPVTVTDGNGCTENTSVTVNEPTALTLATSKTDVTCNAGSNGSATVTPSGATTPYSYSWGNGDTDSTSAGLTQGNYPVTVTDGNGCTENTSVTVNEPTALTLATSKTDVTCNAGSNGSATVTPSGATTPYNYLWGNGDTDSTSAGLTQGNYPVTVTDGNGCTENTSVTVNEPTALTLATSKTDVTCNAGSNGSATVTPSGATTPYSYLWGNGDTDSTSAGLTQGNYPVTVTDGNGCTENASVTVNEPTALTLATSKTDVACNAGSNGSATVTPSGATTPYTYLWGNGDTDSTINNLAQGTYSINVTDANGCSINTNITVNEPSAITISSSTGDALCGNPNGTVSVNAGGGTPGYTYLWQSGATDTLLSGLSAGNYSITVTDNNSCKKTKTIPVSNFNEPAITSGTVTDVSCNGYNDGAINIEITASSPPLSYFWSNNATTEDLTGLTAGTYNVTVQDANGCIAAQTYEIEEPTLLTVGTSFDHVSCFSTDDGNITLTVSGGTPAYSYTWHNGATDSLLNNLSPGTYIVTVSDANGCTEILNTDITEPSPLTLFTSKNDVSCFGGNDGTCAATVNGGTSGYVYSWNTGSTDTLISGLIRGTYYITVTDVNNCMISDSIPINEPDAITVTSTITDATCGNNDGAASLNVSGGTPVYAYQWASGATTSTLSGLNAGNYEVTITDNNNCEEPVVVSLNNINGPAIVSDSVVPVTCNGASNGQVFISANGMALPLSYNWSNGGTTSNLTNLSGGNYGVTVSDTNNCIAVRSYKINEPDLLLINHTKKNVTCYGADNGSIAISVSGGTPGYGYTWSNGASNNQAVGLSGGAYTVTVTDLNNCQNTLNVTINEPNALTVSGTVIHENCGNQNGTITLNTGGGTPGYTYQWQSGRTNAVLQGLNDGTYIVTITDANSCNNAASFTIEDINTLTVQIDSTLGISCSGMTNGAIWTSATGGTFPYTYLWNNGKTEASPTGLTGGIYTLTVTDSLGCKSVDTANINNPEVLVMDLETKDISCFEAQDGMITVDVSGGIPPFNYYLDNEIIRNTHHRSVIITNLNEGDYAVAVDDSNGCQDEDSVSITEPGLPEISIQTGKVSCGNNDGYAAIKVSGEASPYMISWNTGYVGDSLGSLYPGTYSATITDGNGCIVDTATQVQQSLSLPVNVSAQNVRCFGESNGTVSINIISGTEPYNFSWNNGQTMQTATGLKAGDYTVTVTDSTGCMAIREHIISEPEQLLHSKNHNNNTCFNECKGTVTLDVNGGVAPYSYSWGHNKNISLSELKNLCEGTYEVTITDNNGCNVVDLAEITAPEPPESVNLAYEICPGERVELQAIEGGTRYEWGPRGTISDPNTASTMALPINSTDYVVTIHNADNCTWQDTIPVKVKGNIRYTFYLPNAFTPDEDGHNDIFKGIGVTDEILEFEMEIWNRWGERIYYTSDINEGWNGRQNNTGLYVKDGVYVFVIKIKDECGVTMDRWTTKTGHIMVMKGSTKVLSIH